jgi:hypothetical protein
MLNVFEKKSEATSFFDGQLRFNARNRRLDHPSVANHRRDLRSLADFSRLQNNRG